MTRKEIQNEIRKINNGKKYNLDIFKTMRGFKERLSGLNYSWSDVVRVEISRFVFNDIQSINLILVSGIGIGISVNDPKLQRNYSLQIKEVNS